MSSSTGGNSNLPFTLSEQNHLRGPENFKSWHQQMLIQGKPRGMLNYWEGKVNIPTPPLPSPDPNATSDPKPSHTHTLNPSELEYEARESAAHSSILSNVVDIDGSGIDLSKSSASIWKFLNDQYGKPSDRIRKIHERALDDITYVEGTKVAGEDGHIEKMRALWKKARDAGSNINQERFITTLLDSFPETWEHITAPLYKETNLVERNVPGTSVIPKEDSVQALQAQVLALQAQVDTLSSLKVNGPRPKSNIVCLNSQCPNPRGHTIEKCWSLGGGIQGQYPEWWKGKRTVPLPGTTPTAHIAVPGSGVILPGTHLALMAENRPLKDILRENLPSIQRATQCAGLITAGVPDSMSSVLFADSGATAHFFKNRANFTEYEKVSDSVGQSAKEGSGFKIVGVGNVLINVVHNGRSNTLTFRNSYHSPDITANLVSISRLDKLGWKIVFGGGRVRFVDPNGDQQFEGVENGGLYLISGSFITNIPAALIAKSLRSPVPMSTMHRRFCHANE
ncbi:hypothetical protein F5876DRAFT_79216 [Lentinula aff. lateritia]|uniref:Uncharacterized protein n=1 Tax=Lentinula aff. lateritia TaxID=2804960 RepID=A0ACC1TTJ7_9AGAR|nr:hypothetical protein F5876DRAFT_79216 [Lentinula aff. lateritia]